MAGERQGARLMNQSMEELLEKALCLLRQGKLNNLPDYLWDALGDALDRVIKMGEEENNDDG